MKKIKAVSYEDIPEYTGLKNEVQIIVNDGCEWFGDRHGVWVGSIRLDGTIKSAFKKDIANNNTELFDKLRKDIKLIGKYRHLVDNENGERFDATDCYIPYRVAEHSSLRPTVTDNYVDSCMNVHYDVEYEILLVADEEYRRYIIITYETEGSYSSSFFEQIEIIEETFEEFFEEGSNGFKKDDDNNMQVEFCNDIGDQEYLGIDSMDELLSMISSVRVIKCEKTILKD